MDDANDDRKQLLLQLYNQLWNSINARLNLIWESVSILVSAFAIFALTEKNVINLDIATTLIVAISAWFLAHIIDMSYWFNRNLVMIANIERQFLVPDDAKLIYHYFTKHRTNTPVHYYTIQAALGIGIAAIVLLMHFTTRILPQPGRVSLGLSAQSLLPYGVLGIVVILLLIFMRGRNADYADFVTKSPGKDMSSSTDKPSSGEQ